MSNRFKCAVAAVTVPVSISDGTALASGGTTKADH